MRTKAEPLPAGESLWGAALGRFEREMREALREPEDAPPSRWYQPLDANLLALAAAAEADPRRWREWPSGVARPKQRPPEGAWFVWLLQPGRGFGKTRTGAGWFDHRARNHHKRGDQMLLAGRTPSDVEKFALRGPGGLLTHFPDVEYSNRTLSWPNGVTAIVRSGANPEEFRGFGGATAWLDEFAAWQYAMSAWQNMIFGMRERDPRVCVTTTPRPTDAFRMVTRLPSAVVVRGDSHENSANLDQNYITNVLDPYEGTRLGRQEIKGELLEDVEGALWTLAMIDGDRLLWDDDEALWRDAAGEPRYVPDMARVATGVDPQGKRAVDDDRVEAAGQAVKRAANETGIVKVGLGRDGHYYVWEDASCNGSPSEWAARVVACHDREPRGDKVYGERNYGGDMVESTLRNVRRDLPFEFVTATRGKVVRAEPVAALYEQHKVHHMGTFSLLEDEMTRYTGEGERSPNRMDALVWGASALSERGPKKKRRLVPW